ncbi:MAG: sigma-70 family RNA polymerase sigma factor, partial [Kiritimatiellaeota bacterium]|nr:sigma-70 family RNA polymerase sigma factor [Kiritimatiellota bacterium]
MSETNKDERYSTRGTLLKRIQENENDQAAWTEFHEFYFGIVKYWAMKRGFTSEEAEDIYQLVMIRMIKSIKKYDPATKPFRSYLYTFTDRVCKTEYARKMKHQHIELDLNRHDFHSDGEKQEMEEAWIRQVVLTALRATYKRVGDVKYKSFCMRTLDNMAAAEVAKKLGIDRVDTIHMHQTSFRKMLKEEFFRVLEESDEANEYTLRTVDPLLDDALKELVTDKSEYRNTIINPDFPPSELVDRLAFVKGIQKKAETPSDDGGYVFVT